MFQNLQQLTLMAEQENKAFWQIVLEQDSKEKGIPEKEIFDKMQSVYQVMKETDMSYDAVKSASGMVGTSGRMLEQFHHTVPSLLDDFLQQVMERALKTGECNACMKRIVAAPTAGSCGILPSVLISYQSIKKSNDEELTKALFTAAGIGAVIANKASIAGAQGGCQAEIGSASAMAAGALVQLQGGNSEQIIHGAAIALKGLLGLVCDPVAGLVEVPCVKRNVIGAVNAVTSADMAMAGIKSVIKPDEVIEAMDEIGRNMDQKYKETSEGGLAATKTAREIAKALNI